MGGERFFGRPPGQTTLPGVAGPASPAGIPYPRGARQSAGCAKRGSKCRSANAAARGHQAEEGEAQVTGFLKRSADFALDPIAPGEGGAPPESRREDGTLRILPTHRPGGTDGFFIARFARRPNRRARRDLAQGAGAVKSAS